MGDNAAAHSIAQEVLSRFSGEFKAALERIKAEKEGLELRVQELEKQLGQEQSDRRAAEELNELHRQLAQKLYVLAHGHEFGPERWEDFRPEDYTVSADEFLALVDRLDEGK